MSAETMEEVLQLLDTLEDCRNDPGDVANLAGRIREVIEEEG